MPSCKPLEQEEISAIANCLEGRTSARNVALLILGCQVGFRISEMLALRVSHVLCRGRIRDAITVERRHMKGRRDARTTPLSPEAKQCISALLHILRQKGCFKPEAFLFQSERRGNRPVGREHCHRVLKSAAAKAGVRGVVGTHSWRKTFAVNLHEKFCARQMRGERIDPLLCTSKALGHKSLQTTAAYLPFAKQHIDEAILSLGDSIDSKLLTQKLASKTRQKGN